MSNSNNTMRPGRRAELRPEDIAEMRGYPCPACGASYDPLADLIEAGRRLASLLNDRVASDLAIGADAKVEWYALLAWDAALHEIDPGHPAPLLAPYPDATGLISTTDLYDPWFDAMYKRFNGPPETRAKVVCDKWQSPNAPSW